MRTLAIVLFAFSVAFLIIGIHQIMVTGVAESYWILMISTFCLLGYGYIKKYHLEKEEILVETKDAIKAKSFSKSAMLRNRKK